MRLLRQSNGQSIVFGLQTSVAVGGEARIYPVPEDPNLLAKVYHQPTPERARKLEAMLANPPDDPMAAQGHTSIAWPIDLLVSGGIPARIVGFLMPRVDGMRPIIDFYHPKTRRQQCPLFNYLYLHYTARNVAAAVGALHARGYVIGDVNESNILVSPTSLATLVDCDSFQVPDPQNGTAHRCPVGKPEFTPPELQGVRFADVDRGPEHDRFGLAVLIYQLLMEGTHPFAGVFQGRGESPVYGERISAGHFPYSRARRVPYRPMPAAPPFEILHPALRDLFVRCFEEGHANPSARPHARTWQRAMDEAHSVLLKCAANPQHRFGSHLASCPWCDRKARLGGHDPFPSSARRGRAPPPVPVPPAPRPRPAPVPPAPRPRPAPVPPAPRPVALPVETNSIGMKLVLIPAGEFMMGSSDVPRGPLERPPHKVRITKPFYLGQYEVTVGQFRQFVTESGYTGARDVWKTAFPSQTDDQPVVEVNWDDANAFCDWLSKKEGKEYRLPTEAEWEYACRAGTQTKWTFGDNQSELGDYAWFNRNSLSQTHPVGQKKPNAWGLYDMHGNVWEWCADWLGAYYYASSPVDDPNGPSSGTNRVLRGGSWVSAATNSRSANRYRLHPAARYGNSYGFRAARTR